ncbi:MAG: molybdopterin dinucleotide binding domain-containing protein [bacterium]|nr:molybdopterin dinucleotide binding domain-containing protein [bacterium]
MQKVTCNFCTLGCETSLNESDIGVVDIKYSKSGANEGRLCSRGNALPIYLSANQRLTSPLRNGQEINWKDAFNEIISALKNYKASEIAITYDTNLTIEEYSLVSEFAKIKGITKLASSYIEPEHYFNYVLPDVKIANFDDVKDSKTFFIIGDLFSQFPVIAKAILDVRYCSKQNRIFVLDSFVTSTAGFADTFIKTDVGKEALVLLDMANLAKGKTDELKGGIEHSVLSGVLNSLNESEKAVVIASNSFGKTTDPMVFSGMAQYFASSLKGDKKFLWLGESASVPGNVDFSDILSGIKKKEIKCLLNFGAMSPVYYPQIWDYLDELEFMASTVTMMPELAKNRLSYLFMPTTLLTETGGTIKTFFDGEKKVINGVKPLSGTKCVGEIVYALAENKISVVSPGKPVIKELNLEEVLSRAANMVIPQGDYILMGEKTAYQFKGLFSEPIVIMNSHNAKKLKVKEGSVVEIKSSVGESEFKVNISDKVPERVLLVSTELPEARSLFELNISSGICEFPPIEVSVCKRD